jgi:hypothetical protein
MPRLDTIKLDLLLLSLADDRSDDQQDRIPRSRLYRVQYLVSYVCVRVCECACVCVCMCVCVYVYVHASSDDSPNKL